MLHLFSIQNKKEMRKMKPSWRERDDSDNSQLGQLLFYIMAAHLHRLKSIANPTPILGLFWEGVMVRYENDCGTVSIEIFFCFIVGADSSGRGFDCPPQRTSNRVSAGSC